MRPLLLGNGWGGERGGLDRYFTEVASKLSSLTDLSAVVLGPLSGAPAFVHVGADASDPLPIRLFRYRRAVNRERACTDIEVAHFALFAWGARALHRPRRDLIVHFHGPWADESKESGASGLSVATKRAIEQSVYRKARRLIVLSSGFRSVLEVDYGIPPERIEVVPPGVDLDRFRPGPPAGLRASLGVPSAAFVGLSVRRLVPRMGLDTLIDAWALLPTRTPAHLVIAGEGAERGALESHARSVGVGDRVHFIGRISDALLQVWYREADVTVVPSSALEGFGLVVLESLASGTPVIATTVGGLPEALADLDSSLLVPPSDPDALGRRLANAIAHPESLPTAERCRLHAERFTWEATARRCLEIYEASGNRPLIVFTDHCATLSGAEISLLRLAPALLRSVDVHVVLADDGPLASRLRAVGVDVTVLPLHADVRTMSRGRAASAVGRPKVAWRAGMYGIRLARLLRKLRPDLVQSNSLKSGYYTSVASRLAGVPMVWGAKDRVADDYLPPLVARVTRLVAGRATAVVANSETTLRTLTPHRRGQLRVVIGEPTIGDVAHPSRRGTGPTQVGIVGRLAPWKGQDVFLRAFARAFPDGAERAVIVGAPMFGEEEFEDRLRAEARALGIEERVEFRGFREDVAAELAELDLLVHASVIPEPFGMVVIEGMSSGLAVIATDAGGPSEVITSGVDGILVPTGDEAALAAAMHMLAHDTVLRARLGAGARRRASRFNAPEIADELVSFYDEVLHRS